jgi:hypothetical protein
MPESEELRILLLAGGSVLALWVFYFVIVPAVWWVYALWREVVNGE